MKNKILISLILACIFIFTFSLSVMADDCDHSFNITVDFGDSYQMECEKCGDQELFYTYDTVIEILKNYREDLKLENGLTVSFIADSVFIGNSELSDVYISDFAAWNNFLEVKYSEFSSQSYITDFTEYVSQEVEEVTYPVVSSSISQFLINKNSSTGGGVTGDNYDHSHDTHTCPGGSGLNCYAEGYEDGYQSGINAGVDVLAQSQYFQTKLEESTISYVHSEAFNTSQECINIKNDAINTFKVSQEYITTMQSVRDTAISYGVEQYKQSDECADTLLQMYNQGYELGAISGSSAAKEEGRLLGYAEGQEAFKSSEEFKLIKEAQYNLGQRDGYSKGYYEGADSVVNGGASASDVISLIFTVVLLTGLIIGVCFIFKATRKKSRRK
ncbi:MAG: hypothetical protein J6B34_03975 [Clostridia bacterium]|nr:hypothetical protein [Clostridia bacterium]